MNDPRLYHWPSTTAGRKRPLCGTVAQSFLLAAAVDLVTCDGCKRRLARRARRRSTGRPAGTFNAGKLPTAAPVREYAYTPKD
jgi:hypothetical protein